jgi:hypothetical protein
MVTEITSLDVRSLSRNLDAQSHKKQPVLHLIDLGHPRWMEEFIEARR